MISFKIENWNLMRSHNTHLTLLFRGQLLAKVYTHRYYRTCKRVEGVDGRDTLRSIKQIGLCGFRMTFQLKHKRVGFQVGGDSEHMGRHPKHRGPLFRFNTGA